MSDATAADVANLATVMNRALMRLVCVHRFQLPIHVTAIGDDGVRITGTYFADDGDDARFEVEAQSSGGSFATPFDIIYRDANGKEARVAIDLDGAPGASVH